MARVRSKSSDEGEIENTSLLRSDFEGEKGLPPLPHWRKGDWDRKRGIGIRRGLGS